MPIVKRHATEDYVEEVVANLVNSAPETEGMVLETQTFTEWIKQVEEIV